LGNSDGYYRFINYHILSCPMMTGETDATAPPLTKEGMNQGTEQKGTTMKERKL
jgi:hypothetical protein